MPRRTISIRGVADSTLRALRQRAVNSRRSLNSELLLVLEQAAAGPASGGPTHSVREPAATAYRKPAREQLEVNRKLLHSLCARFQIKRLALFGSWARGNAHADSDVDLLAEFESGQTPGLAILTVEAALSRAFGDRRVDLVTARGLRPGLLKQVLTDAVTLHGN